MLKISLSLSLSLSLPVSLSLTYTQWYSKQKWASSHDCAQISLMFSNNVSTTISNFLLLYHHQQYTQRHTLVNKGHCSQYLDLYDLSPLGNPVANLTDIQGIVVPLGPRVGVHMARVLPRLRQGPVVPDVPMVRKTVTDET